MLASPPIKVPYLSLQNSAVEEGRKKKRKKRR
jgi:hypothetical protein